MHIGQLGTARGSEVARAARGSEVARAAEPHK